MDPVKVVFDCNTHFQALVSPGGPAGACLNRVREGQCQLFISEYVLFELRDLPNDAELVAKFPAVTPVRIEQLVAELLKVAVFVTDVPAAYAHPHDPDDSHYINLAVVTDSRLIVSRDRHLLNLMDDTRKEAREFKARFPTLRVLDPPAFLRELQEIRQNAT